MPNNGDVMVELTSLQDVVERHVASAAIHLTSHGSCTLTVSELLPAYAEPVEALKHGMSYREYNFEKNVTIALRNKK